MVFVIVGTLAAAVHFTMAFVLIRLEHVLPLIANFLGWTTAFCVSLTGHLRLTFGDRKVKRVGTTAMFLAVSAIGLLVNELSLWLLMKSSLDYRLALVVSMLVAALLTYVLSNQWVFRSSEARSS